MTPRTDISGFEHRQIKCGDITLHVAQIGQIRQDQGRPVIFLHGFPENWRAFAPIMSAMSDQFLCIAPDQRGYGLSDRPLKTADYQIDVLADDIANLVKTIGAGRVDIVAHDWGGLVAWHFAMRHSALLDRLVVFNAPHPFCLQEALNRDPAQRLASSYAAQFSLPRSHEAFLAKTQDELWEAFFGRDERNGWISHDGKTAILSAWQQIGAWEAMLNWYRASGFDFSGAQPKTRTRPSQIKAPTFLIWGADDPLFAKSVLDGHHDTCSDFKLEMVIGGGHSVFREEPERFATAVRNFLTR